MDHSVQPDSMRLVSQNWHYKKKYLRNERTCSEILDTFWPNCEIVNILLTIVTMKLQTEMVIILQIFHHQMISHYNIESPIYLRFF